MKKRMLQVGLVVALVAVAIMHRGRSALPETPREAIDALFKAASEGDDAAYLALLDGEVRRSLSSTRAQLGVSAFRESLRRSAAGMKGLATTEAEGLEADTVAMDVEIVFEDRNERQQIALAPKGNGWIITGIGKAEVIKPSIPYGTPVFGE